MALMDVTVNETRILNTIWMNPGMSRIGLSRHLNLNKSTITKIVNGLLDQEILILAETSRKQDRKGRRPTGLFINNDLGVIIGLEVDTDSWSGVIVDMQGEILDSMSVENLPQCSSLIALIINVIDSMRIKVEEMGKHLLGVGIGLSGQINPYKGIILSSNPLNVHEPINVQEELASHYPFPVLIENDANCCCWNVFLEKKSARPRNYLCILGKYRRTGLGPENGVAEIKGFAVGMGLVLKDSVLHGDRFTAGEFQSVFKDKPNATQFQLDHLSAVSIPLNQTVRTAILQELARNTALLVNVLNMTMIKIFGNFIEDPEEMRSLFWSEIQRNWLGEELVQCEIETSDQGMNSVPIGAAGFFLSWMFTTPDIWEEREVTHPVGIELLRSTCCPIKTGSTT